MTNQYVDVSENTATGIQCLSQTGIKAVGRYYNYGSGKKVLTRQEAQSLIDKNIAIWVVFEYYNNAAKWFSDALGKKDAVRALECAQEIVGQPEGSTIYFAADYDETGTNYDTAIVPYFKAVRAVFQRPDGSFPFRIGVYSNGLVCRKLLEAGLVTETWLSCSRGFTEHAQFYASKKWSISQTCGEPNVCGLDTDIDEVGPSDFGQFSRLVPLTVSHAAPLAAQMHADFIANANDAGNLQDGVAPPAAAEAGGTFINSLIALASDNNRLQQAQAIAAQRLLAYDGEKYPSDGCAITLSVLLQQAGLDIPDTYRAIDLGNLLKTRGWQQIRIGDQKDGDLGSTCGAVAHHGTDHIYLVLQILNSDEMVVVDNQQSTPHFRFASGKGKSPTTFFLRAPVATS